MAHTNEASMQNGIANDRTAGRTGGHRAIVAMAVLLAACASDGPTSGMLETPLPPAPFVVSNPVASPAAAATGAMTSPHASPGLAWVSLPTGSIPGASGATIRDRRSGAEVTALVTDGGFDPVAVPAESGDTLEMRVQGVPAGPAAYLTVVPASMAPRVVRTNPPRHKRDVPLNSIIIVTFSEPMDSASVVGAVTLRAGTTSVPGSVAVLSGGGVSLRATFSPSAALEPLTTYELQVGTAAQDLDGDSLNAPMLIDFTTAAADSIVPPPDTTLPGPDVTPPAVTLFTPASGDTIAVNFPYFRIGVTDDRSLPELALSIHGAASGDFAAYLRQWPSYDDLAYGNFELPAGTYEFRIEAWDLAGNSTLTAPVTITVVDPDSQPRIVVRSFSMAEYQPSTSPGYWLYTPQLVVADAPGGSGLEIVGFEMLTIPGLAAPFPRVMARWLTVPPDQDTPLFQALYGDYEVEYGSWDGHRSTGGTATARLTYRDASGHLYATTLQGPIVAGSKPPYAGGCSRWRIGSVWLTVNPCSGTSSRAAR